MDSHLAQRKKRARIGYPATFLAELCLCAAASSVPVYVLICPSGTSITWERMRIPSGDRLLIPSDNGTGYLLGVRFLCIMSARAGVPLKASFVLASALLFGLQAAAGQATPRLTDEQARDVASAAIHAVYPEPCYSTYRNERLESFVISVRRNPIVGNHLNNSVYFYRVASDACDYVVEQDGKPVRMSQVSNDCCEYGVVAVDRATAKSYWFAGEKRSDTFKEFTRDEQIRPDSSKPILFTALYRELVWGESGSNEISSFEQLRDVVQQNFQSAYSPYERDNIWQRKFERWWRDFSSRMAQLKLETTYEPTSEGITVRGYLFSGFELTVPRSDPPPKGKPKLLQWGLLVKSDATVERLPSKVIYSAR
jgi:hypothetical protein